MKSYPTTIQEFLDCGHPLVAFAAQRNWELYVTKRNKIGFGIPSKDDNLANLFNWPDSMETGQIWKEVEKGNLYPFYKYYNINRGNASALYSYMESKNYNMSTSSFVRHLEQYSRTPNASKEIFKTKKQKKKILIV